jgi:hypothetical protein
MGAALSNRIQDEIVCVAARQVARWRAVLGPTPNEARVVRWLTKSLLRAPLHPLAPASTGSQRVDGRCQRHERRPSSGVLGRRSPDAHVSSHAGPETVVGLCDAGESDRGAGACRARSRRLFSVADSRPWITHTAKSDKGTRINAAREFGADEI